MKRIDCLSPEQEAELPRFRQEYLDIACCGARADRENLQGALNDAYAVIGRSAPRLFILDSPAACMIAIRMFEAGVRTDFKLRGQLRDQLWDQLGNQLWDQLGNQLWGQLGGQLGNQLGNQLWDQLWDQLRDQLWDQLGNQLRDQLWGQLRDQRLWNPTFLWGAQDLYWIAWGKFAERIGVKLTKDQSHRLDVMDRIGRECEWWWPFENVVIASQRPTTVNWDDQRRLHCEDGPAIEYADGYSLFAWHGTRLPEKWVLERETIDPTEILKEQNVETRTAGAACVGWPRMLTALDYRVIDTDPDGRRGEVIEISPDKLGLNEPGRFLKAECPRNGTIVEGLPHDVDTVLQAQAWRIGLDPAEFSYPTVRT